MNELTILDERVVLEKEFKVYGTKENPLFLAKDVAKWIEYDVSNVSKMLKNVDEDEKTTRTISTNGSYKTEAWFLTEDGLYEVLMQSRKPIAKEFKKEVKKILKQIRQTGGYIPVQEEDDEATILAKALLVAQKTIERKQELINQQQQVIEEQKPKVEGYEQFMETENGLEWDTVAKNLGIGRNIMLRKLRELKILQTDVFEYKGKTYTGDSHNVPYQQYMKYFEVKYVVKEGKRYPKVLVLPTGQEYIRKRLSEE